MNIELRLKDMISTASKSVDLFVIKTADGLQMYNHDKFLMAQKLEQLFFYLNGMHAHIKATCLCADGSFPIDVYPRDKNKQLKGDQSYDTCENGSFGYYHTLEIYENLCSIDLGSVFICNAAELLRDFPESPVQ